MEVHRYNSGDNITSQINTVLALLSQHMPAEYCCVISRAENTQHFEMVAELNRNGLDMNSALMPLLVEHLRQFQPDSQPLILDVPGGYFESALLLPLPAADEVIGLLALFAHEKYTPRSVSIAQPFAALVRSLLENVYLRSLVDGMIAAGEAGIERVRMALINAVTDGVLVVIPSRNGSRVLLANQRFCEIFDLESSKMMNCMLAELIELLPVSEPLRAELERTWLTIAARDPEKHHGAFHMIHADGQMRDLEWYSTPVYHEEHLIARLFIIYDRTAERTAQRVRSAFISRVSHELRTPLTSISGFAEFILEATGDQLPDLAREYTEIILSSARHLNRIFTDLIEISKAEAGELKLQRASAHLPDIIIDVVARLEMLHKERHQQIVMQLDDDLPMVSVDVDRVAQVLTNLVTNAIKYSPESGTIRIVTYYADTLDHLPGSAPADIVLPAVVVSVLDEGDGLSKDEVEKVFMPFFRAERVRKSRIEGAGLGLAVTRSMVEMHRGKIWAEPSHPGRKGGRFFFTLPA